MTKQQAFLVALAFLVLGCGNSPGDGNENNSPDAQPWGYCGDGALDPGEQCDDGALNSDSVPGACRSNCLLPHCGDWIQDSGETCDDGPRNGISPSSCKDDCTTNFCGDGYVGGDEVCDDGNQESGDGCRGDCGQDETLCGNGVLDSGEDCDQGVLNSDEAPNACRTDCQRPRCGDGVLDLGERCDDGNRIDDLTCSSDCRSFCGDGVLNPHLGEGCDEADQNGISPSRCLSGCTLTTCGDGHVGGTEQCDDGNQDPADGCASDCGVEPRWYCSGSPSQCVCSGHAYGPDCQGCVVFVSQDATLVSDGRSWPTAFRTIQEGIDAANSTAEPCEVWVKRGTYHVFVGSERDTLTMRSRVSVFGGFTGHESVREARDATMNETVIDGRAELDDALRVFHVLTAMGISDAVLDGFTVTGGAASGLAPMMDDLGGGLLAYAVVDVSFKHCRFLENLADSNGGGAHVLSSSGVVFEGCRFEDNSANRGGGLNSEDSVLTVESSAFFDNEAERGGGLSNQRGETSVVGCSFSENYASSGAGMLIDESSSTVTSSLFTRNLADSGGGIASVDSFNQTATLTVSRCSFYQNSASSYYGGAGISIGRTTLDLSESYFVSNQGSGLNTSHGVGRVSNCIFTGNTSAGMSNRYSSNLTIENTLFSDNSSSGVLESQSSNHYVGCIITGNKKQSEFGGGVYSYLGASPVFTSCIIAGNFGPGVYNSSSSTSLVSCTVVGNSGHGISASSAAATNSIFWANTGLSINSSTATVTYSDLQGGYAGTGNLDLDPLFIDSWLAGYWSSVYFDPTTFQTVLEDASASFQPGALAGRFAECAPDARWFYIADNTETEIRVYGDLEEAVPLGGAYAVRDLRLSPASPCIDAGDGASAPPLDIEGQPRIDGPGPNVGLGPPWVDMGAYELQ
ncbi:MAG: DUF4215 domain-containing protein [Polyangia bacterium]|nr:DUF4215 domain-containing protein [Polyangia bacterium]